tara:strand:+ start:61 stop:663 length:603 start_codon:yes stop_codon:yes gene_type:complete
MKIVFIIIGILIFPIIIFLFYRYLKVNYQNRKLNTKRFDRISELVHKIDKGENIEEEYILNLVLKAETREMVYQVLNKNNLLNLFPQKFNTIIKGAESNLVNWLEFPTELDVLPDKIEHLEKLIIDFDNNKVIYHIFKFKVDKSHWASDNGWMLGVVGPYFEDSKPYDFPHATFSRLSKLENIEPKDEAMWVHEKISMKL